MSYQPPCILVMMGWFIYLTTHLIISYLAGSMLVGWMVYGSCLDTHKDPGTILLLIGSLHLG